METLIRPLARLTFLGTCSLAASLAFFVAGCGESKQAETKAEGAASPRLKIAYLGLTCEAAMFVAQEKGFYKDEGIEVEFVKTDWDGLRDGLGLGRFDANYTLIMYLLKPIEQGLDVKITGGVHSGCLRVQTGPNSPIQTTADLKGKKIGIPTMGSPPFLFASRALKAQGLDPKKDVEWVVVAPEVMGITLEKGLVDAVADSEPLGSILASKSKVRTLADQAVDEPYRTEYCCAAVVSGKLAKSNPSAAAKLTRAMLKGAMWVDKNPTAAANLAVEKKYVASSAELNAQALGKLKYMPSVSGCRESIGTAAKEMKTAGLLNSSTDPEVLAKSAWIDLEGVSDDWIKGLKVEEVAGGGRPPKLDDSAFAALFENDKELHSILCMGCEGKDSDICIP
ncbi:ABC transporter substrate-binding protein [Singulisphaera sp. PoT]|uniref:ABC transporter substrate-binding protein n=1 Tax=Singulisphaera sp. PoT TaxID=3411797 RepID=UPI003BF4C26A